MRDPLSYVRSLSRPPPPAEPSVAGGLRLRLREPGAAGGARRGRAVAQRGLPAGGRRLQPGSSLRPSAAGRRALWPRHLVPGGRVPRWALRIGSSCTREAGPREGRVSGEGAGLTGTCAQLAASEGWPGAGGRAGFPGHLAPRFPDFACAPRNWRGSEGRAPRVTERCSPQAGTGSRNRGIFPFEGATGLDLEPPRIPPRPRPHWTRRVRRRALIATFPSGPPRTPPNPRSHSSVSGHLPFPMPLEGFSYRPQTGPAHWSGQPRGPRLTAGLPQC